MRVLFVIDSLGQGGAERSLAEMLPGLTAGGVRSSVVLLDHRVPNYEDEVGAASEVVHLRPGRGMTRARELRRLVRERQPDIVHTTLFRSDLFGRLAAHRSGALVVTSLVNTSYGPERLADPNVRRHRLARARHLDGWTARHLTDHFHAVSEPVREAAVRDLGIRPERITVIERGRDPGRLGAPSLERRRRTRAALDIPSGAPVIIAVGRQEYQKGQLGLLAAFDRIAATDPDAILLLVGRPGNATRELEARRAASPMADRIRMLGPRDDVGDLLAASDVFVCPSRYEGFAGAVIEAMALEVPVVATDIPGVRAVVDEGTAVLVPPDDPEQLAAGISRGLGDPEQASAMTSRGRARFTERFTLDAAVGRMLELYSRLLASRRGPSGVPPPV